MKPIENWELKNEIITYIYNITNVNKYRYSIINNEQHLEFLKKNKHYVILNIKTTNYFLIFKYFETFKKNMIVLIDRTTLDFCPKNLNKVVSKSKIYQYNYHSDNSIDMRDFYRGTVMDGKLYNNFFHVCNVFMFKGVDRSLEPTLESWDMLNSENISFIKKVSYYDYDDIPNMKQFFGSNGVNGLMFIPKIPDNQYLYLYKDDKIFTEQSNREESSHIDKNKEKNSILLTTSPIHIETLEVVKTNTIDVYHVYEKNYEKNNEKNNKSILYVPDIETSIMCRRLFEDNKITRISITCKYIPHLCKWQPIIIK